MRILRSFRSTSAFVRAAVIALAVASASLASACGEEPPTRTDVQIKEDVVARLEAGGFTTVTAEVHEGAVTLMGTTYTRADAERAATLVKSVEGVVNVDNRISAGDQAPGGLNASVPSGPDLASPDQVLGAKLTQTFKASPALAGSTITPTVVGGVATLAGTVPSDQAKAEAERLAKTVVGVSSVDNQLQVKAVEVVTVPDKQIEAAVRELLDQSYPDLLITPSVAAGVVKLRGTADSNKQVLEITERISKIKGVKAVDTSLLAKEGSDEGDRIGSPAAKQ